MYAGGVAYNSAINSKIIRAKFTKICCQPAARLGRCFGMCTWIELFIERKTLIIKYLPWKRL